MRKALALSIFAVLLIGMAAASGNPGDQAANALQQLFDAIATMIGNLIDSAMELIPV